MKFPLFFFLLFCAFSSYSQDVIETRSGEKIAGKVFEITETHVRYYSEAQPNGPIRNIAVTEVSTITYADGLKERFVHSSGAGQPTNMEIESRPEKPKSQDPPRDPIFGSGLYLDIMLGYGKNIGFSGDNMYGNTIRFGSKWYFGNSPKYRIGIQSTWLRFGLFADDVQFLNSVRYGYISPLGLGVAQVFKFKETTGLEINTGVAPLVFDFPPEFDELGLLTSFDVKFRVKQLAFGIDYSLNHVRYESPYQIISASFGLKF